MAASDLIEADNPVRLKVLKLAREGLTISKICNQLDLHTSALFRAFDKDPLFRSAWELARKDALEPLIDASLDNFDDADTVVKSIVAKGKADFVAKVAGWRDPRRYGPRLNVDVNVTVDLTQAMRAAEQRTIPIMEQAQIDREQAGQTPSERIPSALPTVLPAIKPAPADDHIYEQKNRTIDAELVEPVSVADLDKYL